MLLRGKLPILHQQIGRQPGSTLFPMQKAEMQLFLVGRQHPKLGIRPSAVLRPVKRDTSSRHPGVDDGGYATGRLECDTGDPRVAETAQVPGHN